MKRNHILLLGVGLSAMVGLYSAGGCSASRDNVFGNDDKGGGGSSASGMGGNGGSTGPGLGGNPSPTGSTGSGSTCNNPGNIDGDMDGFTGDEGDCNDCDANVNPGAIEVIAQPDMMGNTPDPADEDCDGTKDNIASTCDGNIALNDTDPNNGARAVDLCQFATPSDKKWGVLSAAYVRGNGSTAAPTPAIGILNNFGPNVNVQGGSQLLSISSGNARLPGQANACGTYSCSNYGPGSAPPGFPQDSPNCPPSANINDDIGLDLTIRSPTNATGYSFLFKFYSFEYPEWVCMDYNDQFIALITPAPPGSINGNVSFDSLGNPVSVNIGFFDVCPGCPGGTAELNGTGFDVWDDAGATVWLKTQAPVTGGDDVRIRFMIWDTGDSLWDSTAIIDKFEWIANGGTVVVGTEPEIPQ